VSIYDRTQWLGASGQILVSGGGGDVPTWYQAIDPRTDSLLKFLSKLGLNSANFLNTFTVVGGGGSSINVTAVAATTTITVNSYTVPTP